MLRFFFRRQDANHSLCGLFVARYILGVCRLCRLLVDGYVWICLLVRLSFARKYHLKYLVWHVGCSIPVLWTYLLHLLGTTTNKANQDGLPACHILRSGYTISIITLTLRMCPFVAPFKGVWESPDRASIQHAQTRETNTPHTYTRTPWAPTLEQKDHTPRHRHYHTNHLIELPNVSPYTIPYTMPGIPVPGSTLLPQVFMNVCTKSLPSSRRRSRRFAVRTKSLLV